VSLPSTSHFTVVDRFGNVASVTSSIENGFGSRQMAAGFLLNNQLTDFSFVPEGEDGKAIANRVEPGKRPRSSMSPTIILKDGKPVHALGSPGGSRIIAYVAKTIIALIDWDMNIQQAVNLPHLVNRFGTYDIEAGTAAEALKTELEALGYKTSVRDLNSGLHGISIAPDGTIMGGADPRREGLAAGN
ncbi:MAG: gamma-glutamyltransferase, partial [Brucellaceae bacterium]|nr:gamma-glutamyltransferase [Brucellaceae bacterium]